mgnify:CR=1 FL=1
MFSGGAGVDHCSGGGVEEGRGIIVRRVNLVRRRVVVGGVDSVSGGTEE